MAETAGSKMIEAMAELQGIVTGATPAARIHINGFSYIPEDQWQDIATAQKDGSRFLGVNAQNMIAIIKWADLMMVRYDPDLRQSVPAYGWVIADGPPVTTFSPIQWQPLPSTPLKDRNGRNGHLQVQHNPNP